MVAGTVKYAWFQPGAGPEWADRPSLPEKEASRRARAVRRRTPLYHGDVLFRCRHDSRVR
jgi:hypothetical protein